MPYYRCFYHIVWATKHRRPIITNVCEPILVAALKQKAVSLDCVVIAANGTEDHLHVAIEIPPALAVAKVVGALKGTSAKQLNSSLSLEPLFQWQEGYGVFTVSEKSLPHVLDYISKQKQHHQLGTIHPYFERVE
jgi:putative transposase